MQYAFPKISHEIRGLGKEVEQNLTTAHQGETGGRKIAKISSRNLWITCYLINGSALLKHHK